MVENLIVSAEINKEQRYEQLLPQIIGLIDDESDLIANMANVSSAFNMTFRHLWTGFYLVKGEELVLGPFQGPIACTRIAMGRGVCGTAWSKRRTIVVPDVNAFPGHIACSSASRSEIVVPILKNGEVVAVLDIDSDQPDTFDDIDVKYLEELCEILAEKWQ